MDPFLPQLAPDRAAELLIALLSLLIAIVIALTLFGFVLYKSGSLRHPAPLIVSLSLLTAVALVGGIVTSSPEVLTLAATGVGALAGAISAVYRGRDDAPATDDAPDPPVEDTAPDTPIPPGS